jgi:hypothetical protein
MSTLILNLILDRDKSLTKKIFIEIIKNMQALTICARELATIMFKGHFPPLYNPSALTILGT